MTGSKLGGCWCVGNVCRHAEGQSFGHTLVLQDLGSLSGRGLKFWEGGVFLGPFPVSCMGQPYLSTRMFDHQTSIKF